MEKTKAEDAMEELTLALMYLSRMKNPKEPFYTVWKNYDFSTIDKLDEEGYIGQSRKMAVFREEGLERARKILEKYNISDWPEGTFT